jgi:hypothetical protein
MLMFEITILDFMDKKVADFMEMNQNCKDAEFATVLEAAKRDRNKGHELFMRKSYKQAISW